MDYCLLNAENQGYQIPELLKRKSVEVGDTVKLVFRFRSDDTKCRFVRDGYSTERMWVRITVSENDKFVGLLDNTPYAKTKVLTHGTVVEFAPENIIEIQSSAPEKVAELDAMILSVMAELGPNATEEDIMAYVMAMNIRGVHSDCKPY
jgi:hypothetical protein